MSTTIAISDNTWKELNELKRRGDTFNDVLGVMLEERKARCNKRNGD